jgi:hypothetical protein
MDSPLAVSAARRRGPLVRSGRVDGRTEAAAMPTTGLTFDLVMDSRNLAESGPIHATPASSVRRRLRSRMILVRIDAWLDTLAASFRTRA